MSLTVNGVWKAGVWNPAVWANGVWYEPASIQSSGGGYQPTYHYWAYIDDEDEKLERQRKKTEHAAYVRKAAVEAVTSSYNDIKKQNKVRQDALALRKLKTIANDLEFEITAIDKVLLKMEMDRLRIEMDREDEESLMILM